MRKPLKILLMLIAVPVVLLVILFVGILLFVNAAAKEGIQRGGSYALGVPTTVSSVNVGLFSGRLGLSGLSVANPPGFKSDRFFSMGEGNVAVSIPSLRQDTITIPTLSLDNITVNLERKGGQSNYQAILDNLKKLGGGGEKPQPQPSQGGEKRLIINDLSITRVTVHANLVDAPGAVGQLANVTVPIDQIKLSNVGKDTGSGVGGSGVTMSQLSSIVVQAVLAAAAEKGADLGPIAGELKNAVAQLGDLKNLNTQVIGKAGEAAQQIGAQLGQSTEQINKAAENVQKQVEGATKNAQEQLDKLKGLIPGEKSKPKQ